MKAETIEVKAEENIPVEKEYRVIFKENRSFELYVGRNMYRFEPNEEKMLKESEIKSEDFRNQRKFFTVIG